MRDALTEDQAIASVLRSLAPPDLYIGVRRLRTSDVASLHDVERRSIVRATPIRQREFGSGRALLRAMLELDVPVPRSASRSPVFPRGTVGSLAHDSKFAVAALGSTQHFAAIGIDVEPVQTLDEATDRLIRLPGEEAFDTIALHAAKEATFKAWSRHHPGLLMHGDITVDIDGTRFEASVARTQGRFSGDVVRVQDRWLALVAVGAGSNPRRSR